MPMIPYGSRYTAKMRVISWVPRHCKSCGQQFAYAAEVKSEGEATSLLWINQGGAKDRAASAAIENLRTSLKEIDANTPPVTCPRCGRMGKSDVARFNRSRREKVFSRVVGVGILAWIASFCFWVSSLSSENFANGALVTLLGLGVWVAGGVTVRWWMATHPFDPNAPKLIQPDRPYHPDLYPVLVRADVDAPTSKWRAEGAVVIDPVWPDT